MQDQIALLYVDVLPITDVIDLASSRKKFAGRCAGVSQRCNQPRGKFAIYRCGVGISNRRYKVRIDASNGELKSFNTAFGIERTGWKFRVGEIEWLVI